VSSGPLALGGVIPPLALPLQPDGAPDFASLQRQVRYLLDAGVAGLWVNGTTGEFYALAADERGRVVREVAAVVAGRVPVIVQVGDTSTRRALCHLAAAAQAGATHVAAAPPFYVPFAEDELLAYYRALAAASPLPLLVYQVPQMTKVALSVPAILALAGEGAIAGIKDSANDLVFFQDLVRQARAARAPLACFVGGAGLLHASLLAGGDGLMCAVANLVPRHCLALYRAARAGDWDTSARLQAELQTLTDALALAHRPHWATTVAVYKWLLQALGLIEHAAVSAPLAPLNAADAQSLAAGALPIIRRLEAAQGGPEV
jgi:4-hydroxy-tetrahydrodipicolinate synthase